MPSNSKVTGKSKTPCYMCSLPIASSKTATTSALGIVNMSPARIAFR